ncbi:MAG: hypothetical protein AAFN80_16570 [Pseudomonadota bacterium]
MSEPLVMAGSDGFQPDYGFDIASVLDVKSNALTVAGLPPTPSPREVFQSLSSYLNKAKAT